MRPPAWPILIALLAATPALAGLDPEHPNLTHCAAVDCDKDLARFEWQGESRSLPVTFVSRASGAHLHGTLFAPLENASSDQGHPGIVILPGSSGIARETNYRWSARDLAGHGYVVLSIDPQGVGQSETFGHPPCSATAAPPCPGVPFQQMAVWVDAGQSGLDFLLSRDHPFHELLDRGQIGAAGHSLGARAVSVMQDVDERVKAIVAWDNLASSSEGDSGSASGGPPAGTLVGGEIPGAATPITPRRPAMGQASDAGGVQFNASNPEIKKAAYGLWRGQGIPAMELVFRDAPHGRWAQSNVGPQTGRSGDLFVLEHYTRAWFDLWLRGDASALERLMADEVGGAPRQTLLSADYRSGLYLPDAGKDCPDFVACP